MSYNQSEELERRMKLNEIEKDLEILEIIKKYTKNIFIGIDIVDKDECFGTIMLHWGDVNYQIYGTHEYEEVLELKKLQEWIKDE